VWPVAFFFATFGVFANDAGPKVAPRTIGDITTLLDQFKPDPSKAAEVRRILDKPVPDTKDRKDLARFYKEKAVAANDVGAARENVLAMRKVVELGGEFDLAEDLVLLSSAESMAGNLLQAMVARNEVIAKFTNQPFAQGRLIAAYTQNAALYAQLGNLEQTEIAIKSAENALRAALSTPAAASLSSTWTFILDRGKARLLLYQGKFAEAEALYRHAVAEMPGVISDSDINRRTRRFGVSVPESVVQYWGYLNQSNLAEAVAAQGRLTEAEYLARGALFDGIKTFGRYSYYNGILATPYVRILLRQGRYVESEQLARAGLDIFRQVGTPEDSVNSYDLRSDLGIALVAQRRYAEALSEFKGMRDAFATLPAIQSKLVSGNLYWALALIETGDTTAAITMLDTLLEKSRQWLGADHADTATLQTARGMALVRAGQREAALKDFRGAQAVMMADALTQSDEASLLKVQTTTVLLEAYLRLLGDIHGTPLEKTAGVNAANEAFRIADLLRGQSTQQAVVASAVRAAASDPLIGKEIRKEQDLQQEISALYRILRDLMTAPQEQQLPKVMADMQRRIENLRKEQKQLEADIAKRFPAYANLIRPQPPSLAEARAILRPNEALLNLFTATSGTYIWAMRSSGTVSFVVVSLNRDQISGMVTKLRKALDPGEVDIAAQLPKYDLEVGHQLYTALLEPVAAGWKGADSLLVAANGALSQLPLAILPTAKSTMPATRGMRYGEYAAVPWLIRQAAVTQLPSVNALVVLRRLPPASADRTPFIGFGDPQFGKTQVAASSARKLRNLAIDRPAMPTAPPNVASVTPTVSSADWMDYSTIPPLPDTREEILSLAATLNADPSKDVFLGAEASKANVKRVDLSKRRVVAFATHGLLPGDYPGVSEPSLALANPNDGTHGLLTLEEILGLKLDADWVVLSACNTAAGDGSGADAVSGLGRGFFYAGSRALLVTHWPVESVSARLLVTGLFDRQAKDGALSRAEALRQSMLSLMQQNSGSFAYAHPLFWAPYALVGDGGK
jgi:CHAT domain-containing protein